MHGTQHHEWHPDLILASTHEHRIYADDYCHVWAVVDEADYWYFSRWRWTAITNSTGKKFYLIRQAARGGKVNTIYLHKAIHQRRGIPQPTPRHYMVDHLNGDSLYCRRHNLEWATPSMNSRNRGGQARMRI